MKLTKQERRKRIESIIEQKKEELEIFNNSFIVPLKNQIKLLNEIKLGYGNLNNFIKINEGWNKFLMRFLNVNKKNKGKTL